MNPRDLDNWITGHYGEDQFKDNEMNNKQNVKIVIDANTTREDAETLIEFLSKLLNETMGIEAVVMLVIEDNNGKPIDVKMIIENKNESQNS